MDRLKSAIPLFVVGLAFLASLVVLAWTTEVSAAGGTFGGGDGSPIEPYLIEDVDDLQKMNDAPEAHYMLANDIQANVTSGWNGDVGFIPIRSFSGVLDGQGFTIFDLYIRQPGGFPAGLFGSITPGAFVRNLNLVNSQVTGPDGVGTIVGINFGGTITDVTCHGNVTGEYEGIGGIVGYNLGNITNSIFRGNVTSPGSVVGGIAGFLGYFGYGYGTVTYTPNHGNVNGYDAVGGIAGYLEDGYIQAATNHGNVTGRNSVGGMAGLNDFSSRIVSSCNMGEISGTGYVGGLVGDNGAKVESSCNHGSVTGASQIGGLVGSNSGTVDDSYTTGKVNGTGADIGGLAGANSGTITASFWDNETSAVTTSAGGTGMDTADMMRAATFTDAGWVLEELWALRPASTYPFFVWSDWNLAPTANDDPFIVPADRPSRILAPGVLANDGDPDEGLVPSSGGYHLSVVSFDALSAKGAKVHVLPDGSVFYDPSAVTALVNLSLGEHVNDTFTYTISDELGGKATATVTVTVNGTRAEKECPSQTTETPVWAYPAAGAAVVLGLVALGLARKR